MHGKCRATVRAVNRRGGASRKRVPDKHLVPVDHSVAGSGGITDLPDPDR
jgi:hypothetical protein